MKEHELLPWTSSYSLTDTNMHRVLFEGTDDLIAGYVITHSLRNAEHIVKCVNSHQDLVDAAKDVLNWRQFYSSADLLLIKKLEQALLNAGVVI